jgi:hypothetical protein
MSSDACCVVGSPFVAALANFFIFTHCIFNSKTLLLVVSWLNFSSYHGSLVLILVVLFVAAPLFLLVMCYGTMTTVMVLQLLLC